MYVVQESSPTGVRKRERGGEDLSYEQLTHEEGRLVQVEKPWPAGETRLEECRESQPKDELQKILNLPE
jgi:hypothetical protein